jgi:acylphosphatase
MEDNIHYKIRVKGRVQGVGFRWSAVREAESLGINGYVKNMSDGSVYIEAEGSRQQLDSFTGWCRLGPGIGHVESVDVSEYPPEGFERFEIRR